MLGNVGSTLQQIATQFTTGNIPLAIATLAIAGGALMLFTGRLHVLYFLYILIAAALIGSAGAIASTMIAG